MTDLPAYPPHQSSFLLDLPTHLALNAPEPSLDAIWEHVKRITSEIRPVIASSLHNPRGIGSGSYGYNVNTKGDAYYHGRKATFVVYEEPLWEDEARCLSGGCQYGWEVTSPTVKGDGSHYRSAKDDAGYITWHRLD